MPIDFHLLIVLSRRHFKCNTDIQRPACLCTIVMKYIWAILNADWHLFYDFAVSVSSDILA